MPLNAVKSLFHVGMRRVLVLGTNPHEMARNSKSFIVGHLWILHVSFVIYFTLIHILLSQKHQTRVIHVS